VSDEMIRPSWQDAAERTMAAYEAERGLVAQLRHQAEVDTAALAAERALADDLMDVLSHMVVGWENIIGHDLAQHPSVQRVAARYREARR
jgi:hypothetical protein